MSLYNTMFGVSPATFWILPMLGKHPDEYPRFRDCFLNNEERPEFNEHIHVYTRTGGDNREYYEVENQAMREMSEYVTDFDDSFDNTYASWVFRIPKKWKSDYDQIKAGNIIEVSDDYKVEVRRVYPKLAEKWNEFFAIIVQSDEP